MRVSNLLSLPAPLGFAEIERRRCEVVRELAAAHNRRESLLLADDSDEAVASCDAEADRLHLVLERLEAAEAVLRNSGLPPVAGMHAIRSTLR